VTSARPTGRLVLRPLTEWGYRRYRRTDHTPRVAYSAMRRLFAADPEGFSRLVMRSQEEHPLLEGIDASAGIAGGEVHAVVAALRRDGVAVLSQRLPEQECAELESTARRAECVLTTRVGDGPARSSFDPEDIVAVRYDLLETDVLESVAAQRLLADQSLLSIAQQYLEAAPVQDMVAMWWSAAAADQPSSAAAQLYHFDLDRLRFLKVFVYLSDVDETTGPHSYVRGSHREAPLAFRDDRRYADGEVEAAYGDAVVTIAGPRGTVFLADTRGLHKGQPLESGNRLVFQMEYSTSLFGQDVQRPHLAEMTSELLAVVKRFPWTYRRFTTGPG
jgi:hypothetical protein